MESDIIKMLKIEVLNSSIPIKGIYVGIDLFVALLQNNEIKSRDLTHFGNPQTLTGEKDYFFNNNILVRENDNIDTWEYEIHYERSK